MALHPPPQLLRGLLCLVGAVPLALDAGHWWTIAGPAVMTALLTRYSGAGLLEKTIVDRRPGYREYMDKTSPFVPLPPRA